MLVNTWIKEDEIWIDAGYRKQKLCKFFQGKWMLKIEYCIEVLGAKLVNDLIKENLNLKSLKNQIIDKSFPSKSYNELLEQLCKLADSDVANRAKNKEYSQVHMKL